MTILVVCALQIEHRLLSRLARIPGVEVHVTGMGPDRARTWAERSIVPGQRAVIAAGFCGALDPDLERGTLIAADVVVDGPDGDAFACDPRLLDAVGDTHRGRLISLARIARTPPERAALTGTIVDMESAALARVAADRGVPFVAIRAVTDRAHDRLPDLEAVVDGLGRPRPDRLAGLLIRQPRTLGSLVRLLRGVITVRRSLPNLLTGVVERVP